MNQGTLELTLLHPNGTPARDPHTLATFLRTPEGKEIGRATLKFPPAQRVKLPAFPQERAIACVITPERYCHREVGGFTLTDGETIYRQPTVFGLPLRWTPSLKKWASLPAATFQGFKDLLKASPDVRIKGGSCSAHSWAPRTTALIPRNGPRPMPRHPCSTCSPNSTRRRASLRTQAVVPISDDAAGHRSGTADRAGRRGDVGAGR